MVWRSRNHLPGLLGVAIGGLIFFPFGLDWIVNVQTAIFPNSSPSTVGRVRPRR